MANNFKYYINIHIIIKLIVYKAVPNFNNKLNELSDH